ncbi:MAG: 1-(5-phosphoribosyl)-5-amino-4-imidazole-carboxylate carboxylase, partial [Clostridia bacterium]|nr:1-(5-phosphoribosyl)-5-amino-4-imidazole-carboxylate carboxylase [Clostridia bacterium]
MSDKMYENVGDFACLDLDRKRRTGFPEVVFCQGKKRDHCVEIFKTLYENNGLVLGTRASEEQYEAVKAALPNAV